MSLTYVGAIGIISLCLFVAFDRYANPQPKAKCQTIACLIERSK